MKVYYGRPATPGGRTRPETAVSTSEDDGAGFYEVEYSEPLLTFVMPNRAVRRKIRELLAELPIEPFKRPTVSVFDVEHAQARGGLDAIMDALFEDIQSDYRDNMADSSDWHGGFDYVVVDSVFVPGAHEILTRLFYDDGPGELYYGCVVQRASRDEFLLWMTD